MEEANTCGVDIQGGPSRIPRFIRGEEPSGDKSMKRWTAALLFATLVTALVGYFTHGPRLLDATLTFTSFQAIHKHRREILFYGDSMVTGLNLQDLKSRLEREYGRFEVTITQVGSNGDTLNELLAGKSRAVVSRKWRYIEHGYQENGVEYHPDIPDAVIVYWDSDVMLEDNSWTVEKSTEKRDAYRKKLHSLLAYLAHNVRYIAVAGPGLSGEFHGVDKVNPRDAIFDAYTQINREVASKLHIPYLNIRTMLKDKLPATYDKYDGFLTIDGEHLNDKGSAAVKETFFQTLSGWSGLWTIQKDEIGVEIMNRQIAHGRLPDKSTSERRHDGSHTNRDQNEGTGTEKLLSGRVKKGNELYKFKDRVPRNTKFDDDRRQAKFERYWRWRDKLESET